ncbi:hypothetical protein AgCh_028890 [Apium graveolens]
MKSLGKVPVNKVDMVVFQEKPMREGKEAEALEKHRIGPVHLDFEDEKEESDPEKDKPTLSNVETDQENKEWDPEKKVGEGKIPLEQLLEVRGVQGRISSNPEISLGTADTIGSSEGNRDDEQVSDGEDGTYYKDLRKVMEKMKAEKGGFWPNNGIFLYKKIRDLLQGVGDLKFNGGIDPVEYLNCFNIEMEVYQLWKLIEVETKLKAYLEAGERVETPEFELSSIQNSATSLRESFFSFLLKDFVLHRIEEILEELELREHFHARDIIEKIDWLASVTDGNSLALTYWDQKSDAGEGPHMNIWKEEMPTHSNQEN